MIDLKDLPFDELTELVKGLDEGAFRAKQIYSWLHKGAENFSDMKNIGKALREKLEKVSYVTCPEIVLKKVSKLDGTVKYLFGLEDGNCIETVVMKYEYGFLK